MLLFLAFKAVKAARLPLLACLIAVGAWASEPANKAIMINVLGVAFVIVVLLIVKPRSEG